MACGVLATGNNRAVALFTDTSVACADKQHRNQQLKRAGKHQLGGGMRIGGLKAGKDFPADVLVHNNRVCVEI
jgi:hypothetical protein